MMALECNNDLHSLFMEPIRLASIICEVTRQVKVHYLCRQQRIFPILSLIGSGQALEISWF